MNRTPQRILNPLIVVLMLAGAALASSDLSGPPPSAAEAYNHAVNVVVVKVNSIEETDARFTPYPDVKTELARVTVEKVYKGRLKPGQELVFVLKEIWIESVLPSVGAVGTNSLLYLGDPREDGYWNPVKLGARSGRIDHVAADILYLDNIEKGFGRTRLSGRLTKRLHTARSVNWEFLEGLTVTIKGKDRVINLKTGKYGVYEVYDLPPGSYTVETQVIKGFRATMSYYLVSPTVTIQDGSQAEMPFDYIVDNSLSGRVLDAAGFPLAEATVSLVPVGNGPEPYFHTAGVWTTTGGSFEMDNITPGTYFLVVNPGNKITTREPFSRTYYPNASSLDAARRIHVVPGSHRFGLDIRITETIETVTLSGVVIDSNGKPLKGAYVRFFTDPGDSRAKDPLVLGESEIYTDETGQFSLRIFKGQKGVIFASTLGLPEGSEVRNTDETVKEGFLQVLSPKIEISGEVSISGLELTLQKPKSNSR
jgi:Carboxypeptidase regulatory-like domain